MDTSSSASTEHAVAPSSSGSSLFILLVDDEEAIRIAFSAVLEQASHKVIAVGHGKEAIELMGGERFDVILTDVAMPDIDGLEVIAAAKSMQPTARIVAMSGGTCRLPVSLCLKLARTLGGGTTLMKPFSRQELLMAVEGPLPPAR